jgi:DNA-directed RNA polymerase subunit RPC12/RpoP
MLPPEFSSSSGSIERREFEQLLRDAIIAIKGGNRSLGKRFLDQAALTNSNDARIWIWMSATTDDRDEQRSYLEKAVIIDPSNATAKRGLLMLTGQLSQARVMPEDQGYTPPPEPAPVVAESKTFTCPNCGASITYNTSETRLVCQFCGFTRKVEHLLADESASETLDVVLPTTLAHRWAESQLRLACEQCGAVVLLPPGQTAGSCPYCASNRFVTSPELREMIDPHVIGLFKITPEQAAKNVESWLSKGLLAPDNLAVQHAGMQLHPAYYPFWIFSGTLEIPWFCDFDVGSGKVAHWEAHTGSHFEMFNNILVPGWRKMSSHDLLSIEPFNLDDMTEFSPEFLAGWLALSNDISLADASLLAREKVVKKAQPAIEATVDPARPKRNLKLGVGHWSGLAYKLALLPIYTGNYSFQGKRNHLLINGQTGNVAGHKPVDKLKVAMAIGIAVILCFVVVALIFFILGRNI